jgi:hypothetical protein
MVRDTILVIRHYRCGGEALPVGRLAFKAREGRQTALSGFDSRSLPPNPIRSSPEEPDNAYDQSFASRLMLHILAAYVAKANATTIAVNPKVQGRGVDMLAGIVKNGFLLHRQQFRCLGLSQCWASKPTSPPIIRRLPAVPSVLAIGCYDLVLRNAK